MFYEVIPTKLFRADASTLTYSSEQKIPLGTIVIVPLGRSSVPAIVLKSVSRPSFETKAISRILYKTPLPAHILKTILWFSEYYLTPLPTVAGLFLPTGITKTRRQKTSPLSPNPPKPSYPQILLNSYQRNTLKALQQAPGTTKLLHGVTGSGKTNIYLEMAKNALLLNKSTILLVPEIALTSQLVQIFEATFDTRVTLIHSRQTESERHIIWEKLLNSTTPQIIIGPRSALFSPISNLGLIIIDEAHESAYFQENSPKYSALRLASYMASVLHAPCLLGTATPLISDYYLAAQHNSVVTLSQKAKSTAITPDIKIIDFTDKSNFTKNHYFSTILLNSIKNNLKNHYQTLIFHNRRGSAPLTICEQCGWQALCPHCFLPLTLHSDSFNLICHSCGHTDKIPHSCPECHCLDIIHKGFGTKLLENELIKLFPDAKIARFDADNDKKNSLDALYSDVKCGNLDIIIGTQTIARGLDLPLLATVGIVQADAGLSLPDFSAEEKTFQLLTQVIGRVGRGHLDQASVIIQTFQPNHPAIRHAITSDYAQFYQYLLPKRRQQHLPPFTYLAKVYVTYKTESTTLSKIRQIHRSISSNSHLSVSPPMPAFHERTSTGYTWQIIVKSTSRTHLVAALSDLDPKLKPHISLDPPSLL